MEFICVLQRKNNAIDLLPVAWYVVLQPIFLFFRVRCGRVSEQKKERILLNSLGRRTTTWIFLEPCKIKNIKCYQSSGNPSYNKIIRESYAEFSKQFSWNLKYSKTLDYMLLNSYYSNGKDKSGSILTYTQKLLFEYLNR